MAIKRICKIIEELCHIDLSGNKSVARNILSGLFNNTSYENKREATRA